MTLLGWESRHMRNKTSRARQLPFDLGVFYDNNEHSTCSR
jgi:hypothetical protein